MSTLTHIDQTNLHPLSSGKSEIFHQLFNDYWTRVYNTAFMLIKVREIAEDITQEVFMKLWQSSQDLHKIENPENFLFITTRNLTYNRMKRIKTEDAYIHYLLQMAPEALSGSDALAEYNELHHYIKEGINLLPPQQQKAFKLSRDKGFTHEQIAREMNITRETVKGYIVRSIVFLRQYLKEHAIVLIAFLFSQR